MAAAEDQVRAAAEFLIEARRRSTTDPVWFAQNVLQLRRLPGEPRLQDDPMNSWELDEWTVHLLDAVGDVVRKYKGMETRRNHKGINQISVRSPHGPGKTFGLACLMHWFGFCFASKIPCTAPKEAQLKTRLWPEFRKIRNRALEGYRNLMKVHETTIKWIDRDGRFDEGCQAFMETASSPENLAGLHHKFMLVVVDEASGVDEKFFPALFGAVSTGVIVILVLISNPTKTTGTFADSHLKKAIRQDWYPMHIRLEDSARISRQWVDKMVRKYGKDSPVVAVRCHGDFAKEDANQVISLEWITNAREDSRGPEGDGSLPKWRLSADIADGGTDFTVFTLAMHFDSYVYMVKQWQHSYEGGIAISMAVAEIKRLWKNYKLDAKNGDDIVVDSLGVGAGVHSALACDGYSVIRYVGGAASDNSKQFRDRRSQSYFTAGGRFRQGKIVFADDFVADEEEWTELEGQLCSVRRKPGRDRLEDLVTKQEMTDQGLDSPDRADSVVMQFATQPPTEVDFNVANIALGSRLESAGNGAGIL